MDVQPLVPDGAFGDVRVNAFALLSQGRLSSTLSSELASLRQERAFCPDVRVTIWGLNSVDGIAQSELVRQIQPIVDAGFRVRSVCTPAMALDAVARRQGRATWDVTTAYVALESHAMCLAIMRDGALLFSREIAWEFVDSAEAVRERFVDELRRWLQFFRQSLRVVVRRVVLCGGMPNLRALTSFTGTALNVPVETLDSLSGIDAEVVPEPADVFRSTVAALWPAIAIASQSGEPPNLLPAASRVQPETRRKSGFVAAAAIVAVLIVAVWYLYPRTEREVTQTSPPQPPNRANVADATPAPRPAAPSPQPDLFVGSILYSPQRRLAIVNGRIVRIGDRIGSSTVLYIEPRAVVVQSEDGTKRTLELRRR